MSSDAEIHVSSRVCVVFLRPRVATLRLKNHENRVPRILRASHVLNLCLFRLVMNKPERNSKNSMRGRRHGLTLNKSNTKINMLSADMKN